MLSIESLTMRQSGSAFMATISPDKQDIYVYWYYTQSDISMLSMGDRD